MEKHQFKPFDQVLVRDNNTHPWKCDIFSHYIQNDKFQYRCIGNAYVYCIPYNEETAHLLGTNKEYGKTKKWHVSSHFGNFEEDLDDDELENFIKTAVMNNKDITNFHVRYIDK